MGSKSTKNNKPKEERSPQVGRHPSPASENGEERQMGGTDGANINGADVDDAVIWRRQRWIDGVGKSAVAFVGDKQVGEWTPT